MNSIELFARSRVNSIELFARSRANSTELFVRDRANSTDPRSELCIRKVNKRRQMQLACVYTKILYYGIHLRGVYVHAGSTMHVTEFGRVSPRIHHACTRINVFSLLWTASCGLCTYIL